jgi:hypothetical protein
MHGYTQHPYTFNNEVDDLVKGHRQQNYVWDNWPISYRISHGLNGIRRRSEHLTLTTPIFRTAHNMSRLGYYKTMYM